MYGIFKYIWVIFRANAANVGKYSSPMEHMSMFSSLQCEAPKIAKLVYNYNN